MAIIVEELAAKLGLEVDGAAFKVAEEMLHLAHGGLVALGAAAAAAAAGLAVAVAKTAEHADAIEKAAQRTGIGVEALQALQYAAERADVSAEGLQGALNFMARRGVKDFEAELRRTADELAAMPDGGEKAARAIQLFGKQGAALIPMLNKGSAGLDEMTTLAKEAGIVLGEDMIESGAALKDAIEELQAFIRGLAYLLAGPLLKPVRGWIEAATHWIKANREIIAQKVERTLELVGKALGFVFRLAEPVVDVLLRLDNAILNSKAALLALGAVGLWLAAPFLAPVAAIGLLLMALEEVWGWVTGKRATLLEDELGPFEKFKASLDVINPEDSGMVVAAKMIGQALQAAYDIAMKLRSVMGTGPAGPTTRHGSLGIEYQNGLPAGRALPDWAYEKDPIASLPPTPGWTASGWPADSEARFMFGPGTAPTVRPAGAAAGPTTTIGSITVQAPPGSTAQDVVDLIKEQIGIAQRTEYVTAIAAGAR